MEPYEGANTNLTMGKLAEFLDVRWEDVRDLPRESEIGEDEAGDDDE